MRDTKKILESKTVHLKKKIYKFCFDQFLVKRTVFLLIEKTLLKLKNCRSGQTMQDTKKC